MFNKDRCQRECESRMRTEAEKNPGLLVEISVPFSSYTLYIMKNILCKSSVITDKYIYLYMCVCVYK